MSTGLTPKFRAGTDSQKVTRPRSAQPVDRRRPSRFWGRLFIFLVLVGVAIGAFWLGRNWR
jgi:hypothetical protein